jgi:hypothetical protein
MLPGKVGAARIRISSADGTQTLIAAFEVTTGGVEGVVGNTRTEKDFARFLCRLLSTARTPRWHIIFDTLDIRLSESVVRLLARVYGLKQARRQRQVHRAGLEGHTGCLPLQPGPSRHFSLRFPDTWINQIENWFSILVRKLPRRGPLHRLANQDRRVHRLH